MSWSASTTLLTLTGTDNIANAVGIANSLVSNISVSHRAWLIDNQDVETPSGTTWKETNAIIIHARPGDNLNPSATTGSRGLTEFGDANLSDPTRPTITNGCHYFHNQEYAARTAAEYGWTTSSTVVEVGNAHIYGGMLEAFPHNNTAAGGGCFWMFPGGEVQFIGVNWTRSGGGRFPGSTFRIQETKIMGSGRLGLSILTTSDQIGVKDVVLQDMAAGGYYLSSFQIGDTTFRNIATRGAPMSVAGLDAGDNGFIVDSDEVDSLIAAISVTGGSLVFEQTSYNLTATAGGDQPFSLETPDAGDPLPNVRVRFVRTETRTSDAGPWTRSNINVLASDSTDSSGEIAELILTRKQWNNGETITQGDGFQGFYVHLRKYGFDFESIPKFASGGQGNGLVDNIIMRVNDFVQTPEANVAAFSGIAVNEGNSTVAVTTAHTLQDVYDWIQWNAAQEAQMDFFASGDQWTGDGEVVPLSTQSGSIFVMLSGWTFLSGSVDNIDVEDKILEESDGNRKAPIVINEIEPGFSFRVVQDSDGVTLYSGIIGDNGLREFRTTRTVTSSTSIPVTVIARLQGYINVEVPATITGAGLRVSISPNLDPRYKIGKGKLNQTHYRWRNDDGTESSASWKAAEDIDITGQAKTTNMRLRVQLEEIDGNPDPDFRLKLKFRETGNPYWTDLDPSS